jgi:hypothetical protein
VDLSTTEQYVLALVSVLSILVILSVLVLSRVTCMMSVKYNREKKESLYGNESGIYLCNERTVCVCVYLCIHVHTCLSAHIF